MYTNNNVSDNMSATDRVPPTQCELLCFICDKSKVLPFDHIVKICTDFYREDEVMAA